MVWHKQHIYGVSTESILEQVQSVAEASREQKFGIDQVTQSMNEIAEDFDGARERTESTLALSKAMQVHSEKLQFVRSTMEEVVGGQNPAGGMLGNIHNLIPSSQDSRIVPEDPALIETPVETASDKEDPAA